ncbi:MAG TPA: helix-turn-helix transcriptional regulator [Bryobacteraceae bacterium]|nr:helix-turn-helix transcriptional regulator [Bryobacteraceae bacterium]
MAALSMLSSPYHISGLTPRESEIAVYAALGYNNNQIAHMAGINLQTVKNHLKSCYRALGIVKREQLEPIVYECVPEVREEMKRLGRSPRLVADDKGRTTYGFSPLTNPAFPSESANERKPQARETAEKSVANKNSGGLE